MNKSCLQEAAEAAERVNAMLIAKGKLKPITFQTGAATQSAGNLFTAEVEINDAPLGARNLLTKGVIQDDICRSSGAAISTRGRYMSPMEKLSAGSGERSLYLHVQASSQEPVDKAVARIKDIMNLKTKDRDSVTTVENVEYSPALPDPISGVLPPTLSLTSVSTSAGGLRFVQDKIFVGLEHAPVNFPVKEKILGPMGSYLHHIKTETGATVTLRGKGSGFLEPTSGREAFEPLHIHITHPKLEGLQMAKTLAVSLIQTTHADFAQWQQQQLAGIVLQSTADPTTSVIAGIAPAPVFQQVATAAEVPTQSIIVSPGVTGTQTGQSIVVPVSITSSVPSSAFSAAVVPSTLTYVTAYQTTTPVTVASSSVVPHQVLPQTVMYPTSVITTQPCSTQPLITVPAQIQTSVPSQIQASVPAQIQVSSAQIAALASAQIQASSATSLPAPVAPRPSFSFSSFPLAPTSTVYPHLRDQYAHLLQKRRFTESQVEQDKVSSLQAMRSTEALYHRAQRFSSDSKLMPPPIGPALKLPAANYCDKALKRTAAGEPERKRSRGALSGIAAMYASDDSSDDEPSSPIGSPKVKFFADARLNRSFNPAAESRLNRSYNSDTRLNRSYNSFTNKQVL